MIWNNWQKDTVKILTQSTISNLRVKWKMLLSTRLVGFQVGEIKELQNLRLDRVNLIFNQTIKI